VNLPFACGRSHYICFQRFGFCLAARYFAASFQSRAYLAAMKAHVSQFPIAESAQDNQIRLAFAMNEKSRDAFIDEQVKKPSADRAGVLPNEGRPGIAGVAVQ